MNILWCKPTLGDQGTLQKSLSGGGGAETQGGVFVQCGLQYDEEPLGRRARIDI